MEISPRAARATRVFTWVMAAAGTVIGQIHALARFVEHPDDLVESPLATVWAVPATRALQPLLDWSDPWTVYVTYGKIWVLVSVAILAAAHLAYRRRRPRGAERRLWQIQLGAYVVMTASVFGDYVTPWWMEQMFVVGIAALPVIGVGGAALGIVMVRNGFRPRVTPVLLIAFLPLVVAITSVTALGSALLPLVWGWAVAAQTAAEPIRVQRPAALRT